MSEGAFVGQVAQTAGVSVQTVRYYERLGLLPAPQRTDSGYRVYRAETVERLRFIRRAQAVGFRLDEIREILRLKYEGQAPCDCVRGLLQRKLERVEQQMAELVRFRRELRKTLARAKNLPRLHHRASAICPIIEEQPLRRWQKNVGERQRRKEVKGNGPQRR
jgi:DNA-binding transcriptional MerR regulator